jgi:hypothetical protein
VYRRDWPHVRPLNRERRNWLWNINQALKPERRRKLQTRDGDWKPGSVNQGPHEPILRLQQNFKWVESHVTDGTKLLLNKRPIVPGETLRPGQERIGNMVYDVYYWNPTPEQLSATPNLRAVIGLSGAGTLHAIIPEGASVLTVESGEHTVPVKIQDLPATASEINYLTRLMMEHLSPQTPALSPAAPTR